MSSPTHKHLKLKALRIDGHNVRLDQLVFAARAAQTVNISTDVGNRIAKSHEMLRQFVRDGRIIYGVNTSLGGLVNWLIPEARSHEMQANLIAAVATNVGPYLGDDVVRATMIARLNSLARGISAISLVNFKKLLDIYNAGIVPCIPAKGSLGASGDLGPLACIALVATGKWKARYQGAIVSGQSALDEARLEPMHLTYKEGLSLINGTSTMVAQGALVIEDSIKFVQLYDAISTLSLEALNSTKKPFDPIVHEGQTSPYKLFLVEC